MRPIQTAGAFSWPELQTTDLDGASAFYSAVFGWEMQFMDMAMGKYGVGSLGESPVAGLHKGMEEDTPVNWSFYVTVTDVSACLKKAEGLGATVLVEPMNIPGVGRMGVFQDPQGAVLSLMAYEDPEHEVHQSEHEASFGTPGAFSWFELRVPDAALAIDFYSTLFGWETSVMDMDMGAYHVISVGGANMGGMISVSPDEMPPHWGGYVTVADAAVFVKNVGNAGGKVLYGPHEVPGVGHMVMFSDPQGGRLSGVQYGNA